MRSAYIISMEPHQIVAIFSFMLLSPILKG